MVERVTTFYYTYRGKFKDLENLNLFLQELKQLCGKLRPITPREDDIAEGYLSCKNDLTDFSNIEVFIKSEIQMYESMQVKNYFDVFVKVSPQKERCEKVSALFEKYSDKFRRSLPIEPDEHSIAEFYLKHRKSFDKIAEEIGTGIEYAKKRVLGLNRYVAPYVKGESQHPLLKDVHQALEEDELSVHDQGVKCKECGCIVKEHITRSTTILYSCPEHGEFKLFIDDLLDVDSKVNSDDHELEQEQEQERERERDLERERDKDVDQSKIPNEEKEYNNVNQGKDE